MKTLEEHVDEVMECFDFEKVHHVMTMLDWKWALYITGPEVKNRNGRMIGTVPGIPDLRKQVCELMRRLWNSDNQSVATGGFVVRLYREENWARFSVAFEVTDWVSEDAEKTFAVATYWND